MNNYSFISIFFYDYLAESIGNNRSDPLKRLMSEDDDVIYRPTFGGAAHECCRRSCGYSELRSYCAD